MNLKWVNKARGVVITRGFSRKGRVWLDRRRNWSAGRSSIKGQRFEKCCNILYELLCFYETDKTQEQ